MGSARRLPLLLLLVMLTAISVEGYRVLMLAPSGGKSQKNVFYGLGSGLVARGHEVVFFNGFRPSTPVRGIREVVPDELAKVYADGNLPNMFKMNKEGMKAGWKQSQTLMTEGNRAALFSKELDELLREKFDLVVIGVFAHSFHFIPHVLKTPYIFLCPVPYLPVMTSLLGNPTIPAMHPTGLVLATDRMTFFQRVENLISHLFLDVFIRMYASYCDGLVAEKFGAGVMPPTLEMGRNASLIMLNSNQAMDYPKVLLPNTIEVGGMHCAKPKPLPKDLTDFLGNSEFIFFSLGSVVRLQDMSPAQKSAILTTLGSMPFKVLLKWDTTDRAGIPSNILPSKWLPQQDIIGNSRCSLFISHGGFASLVESVCHGVPMVMLPVSGDQQFNAANAVQLGLAEQLSWDVLTPETLKSAIRAALSPGHRAAARHRRQLMKEQPVPPRDLAVHWVEHVIRHGGAPHLHSVGAELNFLQYYSLDVLAFLLAVLLLLLKLLVVVVKCCCSRVCGRKASRTPAEIKAMAKHAKSE